MNHSTVSRILRKFTEDPDLLLAAETTHKSQKRKREVLHPELEPALLEWFLHYEGDGVISGELIREKPKLLYTLIYPMEVVPILQFSNEWLDSFKSRHEICDFNHHGESGSAGMNAIAEQRSEIAKIVALYEYE